MNIALIGYGKMGRMIEQIALERGHKIVCVVDIDNHNDINSDAFRSADVAIEFTAPTSAYQNVKDAFAQDVKVVSGSTGWMNEHGDEMKKLCEQGLHTLFWSSNFSVGVALFNALNTYLAKLMNKFPSYDVKIEEPIIFTNSMHPAARLSLLRKASSGILTAKTAGKKEYLPLPTAR